MPRSNVHGPSSVNCATATRSTGIGPITWTYSATCLIDKYEQAHHPLPPISEVDMLRHFLDTRRVTRSETARGAGIAVSTLSFSPAAFLRSRLETP
jgi:hypothetical protein